MGRGWTGSTTDSVVAEDADIDSPSDSVLGNSSSVEVAASPTAAGVSVIVRPVFREHSANHRAGSLPEKMAVTVSVANIMKSAPIRLHRERMPSSCAGLGLCPSRPFNASRGCLRWWVGESVSAAWRLRVLMGTDDEEDRKMGWNTS